jgi:Domain of Unknown Function (DUF1080)
MADESKSGGILVKVVSGIIGIATAIAVPVVVSRLTKDPPASPAAPPGAPSTPTPGGTTEKTPDQPKPITLFNGTDLTGFYTYVGGRHMDPNKVFTVVKDGPDNVLRISGQDDGYLATEKQNQFQYFKLILKYKWGTETWGPRAEKARLSSVTLLADGDGKYGPDISGYECVIGEGRTGNIALLKGSRDYKLTVDVNPKHIEPPKPANPKWTPTYVAAPGSNKKFDFPFKEGNREHRVVFHKQHDPTLKPEVTDVKGYHYSKDVDKPADWNKLELTVTGSNSGVVHLDVRLNDEQLLRGFSVGLPGPRGRLLFRSQGAEIFFKDIELTPLPPPQPKKDK